MSKKLVVLSMCLIVICLLGGMKGCSVIGVTPSTLQFTAQQVQNGSSQEFLVWSKIPLVKVHVKLECDDDWIEPNPVEFDTMGPWNRVPVAVKVNTSVLASTEQMLESIIRISGKAVLTNQEVTASSNVTVKVNLGGTGQTGGTNGDGEGNGQS